MHFPTKIEDINARISAIDPILYAKTRNYTDGNVSYLSPYLSRGVISLNHIAQEIKQKKLPFNEIESYIKELAWREYYQRVWNNLKDDIFQDIFSEQLQVERIGIPSQILKAEIGIQSVNKSIQNLIETGYMHNHQRMYLSSIICNIGRYHWKIPAQWMYYYLLDADLASNSLSWQWIAGSFSQKKYFANQENINTFTKTTEYDTYLDVNYDELPKLDCPNILEDAVPFSLTSPIPNETRSIHIEQNQPIYIYNFYNLDPNWNITNSKNNILLIEPSIFKKFPISNNSMNFMLELAKNISNIQVFVGEFSELKKLAQNEQIYFKQHPINSHYEGIETSRNWLFPEIDAYYSSFSKYWKNFLPLAKAYFSNEARN